MKNKILGDNKEPEWNSEGILLEAIKFAWKHKGKIIAGVCILASGGVAAPLIATAAGIKSIINLNHWR